jgi:toxin YoeB
MAGRKIVWTESAQKERMDILIYWFEKTKSKRYSKKLNNLIKDTLKLTADFPQAGRKTNSGNARIKVVRDYLIFYDFTPKEIIVLSIWDANRNDNNSIHPYSNLK